MRARNVIYLLVCAIIIRFTYIGLLVLFDGTFLVSDSRMYIELATNIVQTGRMYNIEDGVLPSITRMPIYPHFMAWLFELSGSANHIIIVFGQAVIDALTVLGIALIAAAIRPAWVLPVAILGCIWPNLVVHSSLILTDTLFVFFFTWGICASVWALKGNHVYKLIIFCGLCFGLALMTRPVLMFFPFLLLPLLAYLLKKESNFRWSKSIVIAAVPVIIMLVSVLPRLYETNALYAKPVLTIQSGIAALYWYYPCIKTTWGCGSRLETNKESREQVKKEVEKLDPVVQINPAIIDEVRKKIAVEKIRELQLSSIIAGAIGGAITGLIHTSASVIAHQFNLKKDTIMNPEYGNTAYEKMMNFHEMFINNKFSIVWLISLVAIFVTRVIQLLGIVSIFRDSSINRPMLFLLMTGLYFLVINGPIGDAKYRLPLEPMLIIFFVCGLSQAAFLFRENPSK